MAFVILFVASFWAGAHNALAGGGSFITLPVLMFTGMDALRPCTPVRRMRLTPGGFDIGAWRFD
jgi:uncharacterized membrane protein YfcA